MTITNRKTNLPQWRATRKYGYQPTGLIVVHTAESNTDLVLPDIGAEGVREFIVGRTDYSGSYHDVADSDSIADVIEYDYVAFQVGTYHTNEFALGLSFACHAHQWPTLPDEWVSGAMLQGATAARRMAKWLLNRHNIVVPAEHVTLNEAISGRPGFIGHCELDPTRRTDPGPDFPWQRFLNTFQGGHMWQSTVPEFLHPLSAALAYLDGIYMASPRAEWPSDKERADWRTDLQAKLIRGEDLAPTWRWIIGALAAGA